MLSPASHKVTRHSPNDGSMKRHGDSDADEDADNHDERCDEEREKEF